jgi:hypothetical protein
MIKSLPTEKLKSAKETIMQWIEVKDRLPKRKGWYICRTIYNGTGVRYFDGVSFKNYIGEVLLCWYEIPFKKDKK